MKSYYLLPFLFLGACSSKKDDPTPNPSTETHTVTVNFVSRYIGGGAVTSSMYKPSLTIDKASTPQVDYSVVEKAYVSGQTPFNAQPVTTYTGEETLTMTLSLPGHNPYQQGDYPAGYQTFAFLLVDGKAQNQETLLAEYNMGTWNEVSKTYTKTFTLKSSDVVK